MDFGSIAHSVAVAIASTSHWLGSLVERAFAVVIASIALITFALNQRAASRDRQRQEYAKALQAVMRWVEMPYRVHRARLIGSPNDSQLVEVFHELQEEFAFHESWLAVDSDRIADAYRGLLMAAKRETAGHLRSAWTVNHSGDSPMNLGNVYPVNVDAERRRYVEEVQRHLRWFGVRERLSRLRRKRRTTK